jgi:hypothetical protein
LRSVLEANGVASQDGMVGAPYDALKQACFGAQRDRLLVQFETLTTDPARRCTPSTPLSTSWLLSMTNVPVLRGCTLCAVK